MLRSTGCPVDIRKTIPYEIYNTLNFNTSVTFESDCFARFRIRVLELRQSLFIIIQVCNFLNVISLDSMKNNNPFRAELKTDMSHLIHHFKNIAHGIKLKTTQNYFCIEAPKGETGVFLLSNNTAKSYRCKIKAPGFLHLYAINNLSKFHFLADVVTIIGASDIVFGEVDR